MSVEHYETTTLRLHSNSVAVLSVFERIAYKQPLYCYHSSKVREPLQGNNLSHKLGMIRFQLCSVRQLWN